MLGSKIAGFSRALLSVGKDSASDDDIVIGPSSSELLGDEHDEPVPILPMDPSDPLSMPESVGLSSFRFPDWTGLVTAVIVVPAGIFGCVSVAWPVSSSALEFEFR